MLRCSSAVILSFSQIYLWFLNCDTKFFRLLQNTCCIFRMVSIPAVCMGFVVAGSLEWMVLCSGVCVCATYVLYYYFKGCQRNPLKSMENKHVNLIHMRKANIKNVLYRDTCNFVFRTTYVVGCIHIRNHI